MARTFQTAKRHSPIKLIWGSIKKPPWHCRGLSFLRSLCPRRQVKQSQYCLAPQPRRALGGHPSTPKVRLWRIGHSNSIPVLVKTGIRNSFFPLFLCLSPSFVLFYVPKGVMHLGAKSTRERIREIRFLSLP